ncbi:MAG: ATP-binding protein [Oscillospiraceae bacterium]|nr:ATP-binding protein [Oscillospiraceae bacterium]
MLCTAIYMRKYESIGTKIAALSPCIAKTCEFIDTGHVDYNIIFNGLHKYIESNNIEFPRQASGFDHCKPGLGSLYPTQGGLKENLEHYLGKSLRIDKAEGLSVYKALDTYAEHPESELPVIFDVLSCSEGCNMGTGCKKNTNIFDVNSVMNGLRRSAAQEDNLKYLDELYQKFDDTLNIDDFIRHYSPVPAFPIMVTQEQIDEAFSSLGKYDDASKIFDCGACGCDTCYEMAVKIAKGINVPINCHEKMILLIKEETELTRKAEMANETKSKFLATMSHEIRTPMNAILGIAQINLQKDDLPEEYASEFNKIHNSGSSLLGIINDILDMSKIETGKMEITPAEYDVPSLVHDTAQLNIVRIGSKEIDFILDIDENLPSRMIGDELRLKQILNNLLSNAIKYTEKGHVKLTVSHSACDSDIYLRFMVEDTGQGMKPEDRARLFTEYSRFNTEANRSVEGTGIGLNIVKQLTDLMDGTVEAESEYGKGSVFTVTVKQTAVECPPIGPELSERIRTFSFTMDKQVSQILREPMPYGKVLVVDDVETNLYVAEGLMAPYKLKIETALSGFKAIEKVQSGNIYDIIFMDHMMPLMNGVEATQKLRAMGYKGVIVALTANALTGNDVMFKENGFDDFISKPIDIRHLNAVLVKYVRDRNPDKAVKYKPQAAAAPQTPKVSPKLLEIFRRDAEKAVTVLRETVRDGDLSLFVTTVHAMKSALANIGERKKSGLAAELESAGLKGDAEYIAANSEPFVQALEALIESLSPPEAEADDNVLENTAYLSEQLEAVRAACDDYDDTAAYDALDRLKDMKWKKETSAALEAIRDALFLHSDFENAAERARLFMEKLL